jgi:uncharacterized protein YkwD
MRLIVLTAILSSLVLGVLLLPIASSLGQEAKSKRSSEAPPGPEPSDATLDALLEAHNRVRAEEKRPPLKANALLTRAARDHARDMAERNQLTHEGSDGSDPAMRIKRTGYVFKECAENVAAGQDTVADAMRSWIESPPHRKNILGDFTEIGAAVPKVEASRSPAEMIAALNRARADAKKPPLKADAQLSRIAGRFAREAATRKALDGKDGDGKTPFDVLKSEGFPGRRFAMTLASGEGDPARVLANWLERDEDREALLSKFDRAGVGVATDSEGVPYWVILLSQSVGR